MARLMSSKNLDKEAVEGDVVEVAEEVTVILTMMILMKAAMGIQEDLPEALEQTSLAEAVEEASVVKATKILSNRLDFQTL
jgi:hypothetical protein